MSDGNKRSAKRVVRGNTDAAIHSFLSSLDCPRSLTVWLLYSSGEHDQLSQLEFKPEDYIELTKFRDSYAATCLLSKADFLRTTFNRKQRALDKFLKSEELCRSTNDLIWPFSTPDYKPVEELHPLLSRVRRKIETILGPFNAEELYDSSDWGPGVSTLLKGPTSVKPNKYQQEIGMTQKVRDAVWHTLKYAYPSWWENVLKDTAPLIQVGNVVTTVSKNSKNDRVIAVEPGWNLWFQKGLGEMIRKRLLSRGCDLNDQRINQRLSQLAYSVGLATIDFSMASDTIAYEVVRLLLPSKWFAALCIFRSPLGNLEGVQIPWRKFSSMGNGFTFELESLIFYALALVLCESRSPDRVRYVSVYGDDVILPQEIATEFSELAKLLGFVVNHEKSFFRGDFFESCGCHWFRGRDVTPVYLKSELKETADFFSFHNRVVELASRCMGGYGLDSRFKKLARDLRKMIPSEEVNLVPAYLGDVGFFSPLDAAMKLKTTSFKRMYGWKIRILSEVAKTRYFDGYGLVLDRLRSASRRKGLGPSLFGLPRKVKADKNFVSLKSSTKRVVQYTTVPLGRWCELGPWF